MLRADLGPLTEIRETTKGLDKLCLQEQQKMPGSLLKGSGPFFELIG